MPGIRSERWDETSVREPYPTLFLSASATMLAPKEEPMPQITLYHGTANDFHAFDELSVGRGREPNSALGVHLVEDPAAAAEYARLCARSRNSAEPRVLVVEVEVERVATCTSRRDFLGLDDDAGHGRTHEDFAEQRRRLMEEGYQAIVCDEIGDDLAGCWTVFDPASIRIVRRMTIEESLMAAESHTPGALWDIEFENVDLFEDRVAVPALGR